MSGAVIDHNGNHQHHSEMDASSNGENGHSHPEDEIPEIELIIRASAIDGPTKGSLSLLSGVLHGPLSSSGNEDDFTESHNRRHEQATSRLPVAIRVNTSAHLIDGDNPPLLDNEKIERYIMKSIPGGHNLFVSDKVSEKLIENIYTKFKKMLNNVKDDNAKASLLSQLERINAHLEKRNTRYLTGDSLCCFDCELMTRLQHIRVGGKYFANFEIPDNLVYLWRYIYLMYNLDAFYQSCPADQDIVNHYKQQLRVKVSRHEELEEPTFTRSIPEACMEKFNL